MVMYYSVASLVHANPHLVSIRMYQLALIGKNMADVDFCCYLFSIYQLPYNFLGRSLTLNTQTNKTSTILQYNTSTDSVQ